MQREAVGAERLLRASAHTWKLNQFRQPARGSYAFNLARAISTASAIVGFFAARRSRGNATTYCKSMRAMWRITRFRQWSYTTHQGSPASVWVHSNAQ